MSIGLKRMVTEQQMWRLKAQLEEIEEQEAQAQLEPIERPDDTLVSVSLRARKERLMRDLARCKQAVENAAAPDRTFRR